MAEHQNFRNQNITEWRGKTVVDRDGNKIGRLEDVYVDVETDEPVFGMGRSPDMQRATMRPTAGTSP